MPLRRQVPSLWSSRPAPRYSTRVVDLPADGMGRHFLVERELITNAELEALVADYLAQAQILDAVPAKPSCDDAFELPQAVAR